MERGAWGGTLRGDTTITGATRGALLKWLGGAWAGLAIGKGAKMEVGVVSGTYHSVWAEGTFLTDKVKRADGTGPSERWVRGGQP